MKRVFITLLIVLSALAYNESLAQNIIRLRNGRAEIITENGSYAGYYGYNNVIAASFNYNQTLMLLTYANGKVELRKSPNTIVRTYNVSNAIDAKWHKKDEVLIYRADGKIERRNINGTIIRTL